MLHKKRTFVKVIFSALFCFTLTFLLCSNSALHSLVSVLHPSSILTDSTSSSVHNYNFIVQNVVDDPTILKIAVVICNDYQTLYGADAILYQIRRTKVMLKSILLAQQDHMHKHFQEQQISKTLQIILFTGDENIVTDIKEYLSKAIHPDYLLSVLITFLPVSYPKGYKLWKYIWKPCLTFRLFMHHAMPNADSLLYVDTDTIFMTSAHEIHSEVYSFGEKQWCGMGPDWYHHHHSDRKVFKHPYFGEFGLNSGVVIFNLTKLRAIENSYIQEVTDIYWKYKNYSSFMGDQELYNVYFYNHPDQVKQLSCHSNFIAIFCIASDKSCRLEKPLPITILHGTATLFFKSEKVAGWFYVADEDTQFTIVFSAFEGVDMQNGLVDYFEFRAALRNKLLINQRRKHITKDFQSMCAKNFKFVKNLLG